MPIEPIKRQLKSALLPYQRKFFADRTRNIRKEDKNRNWINDRTIRTLKKDFGVNLIRAVGKKVKSGSKLSVLDVGSGRHVSLIELAKVFGGKIDLHGLTAAQKKDFIHTAYFGKGKVSKDQIKKHIGLFEEYKFKQRFDLIYSFAGLHYSVAPPLVVEKLCNLLNKGGVAIVQYPSSRITPEMKKQMLANGYRFRVAKDKGAFHTDIIVIKNMRGRELSFTPETFTYPRIPTHIEKYEKRLQS